MRGFVGVYLEEAIYVLKIIMSAHRDWWEVVYFFQMLLPFPGRYFCESY